MKKIALTTLLLGFIVLTGCYYDKEEELYPNKFNPCDTTNLTYNTAIKAIINSNCGSSGCHIAGGTSPDLSTYTLLKANITSVKFRAIEVKNMPSPSGMSACNISKLDHWITIGMPEN